MRLIDASGIVTAIFIAAFLIALIYECAWRCSRLLTQFKKASAYEFVLILHRDKWKNASSIKQDMQAHMRAQLKEEDVERSLEMLEAEGLIVSRVGMSDQWWLLSFRCGPEEQYKLNTYDSDNFLAEGPPVPSELLVA